MVTNITVNDDLYHRVAERARAANMTPETWLAEAAHQRIERESRRERRHSFAERNKIDMAKLGVNPSDIEREIADHRRGR